MYVQLIVVFVRLHQAGINRSPSLAGSCGRQSSTTAQLYHRPTVSRRAEKSAVGCGGDGAAELLEN